ncbi:MAG: hypothetical protein ACYTEX_10775 [Planctomycetota bacterium]
MRRIMEDRCCRLCSGLCLLVRPLVSCIRFVACALLMCSLMLAAAGCSSYAQPGETEAEGRRRHARNLTIGQQQMVEDVDTFFLTDKPSKLSRKRVR